MSKYQKPSGSYISFFSNMVKQKGGINLAQGIPGFSPPKELMDALKNSSGLNVHQYAPGMGNANLVKQIANSYKVDSENVIVVQGATEALSLIYTYINRLLDGNFSVLSFEPAYESYLQLPKIFGQRFIHYPLNQDYSFIYDELYLTIKQMGVKLIFLSSPGNPFGKIWSRTEVDSLISISNELGVYLVFDAVYEKLYFEEPPYIPIDRLSPYLFVVNSFSKMLCITGWRIGYLISHESHMDGIKAVHDYIGLCAPSILQYALVGYLDTSNFAFDYIQGFRENVKNSFTILSKTLLELGFTIPPIPGGCFIWAKLPKGWIDGFDFARKLYDEQAVAVIPGEHFSENYSDWIRFNIARPEEEIILACKQIRSFFETSKP